MAAEAEPLVNPPHYPHGGTYADLLCWHMDYWGTRPRGNTAVHGKPWAPDEFKREFWGGKEFDGANARILLARWRGKGSAPKPGHGASVSRVLFGGNSVFNQLAKDLEAARIASQGADQNIQTAKIPDPPPVPSSTESVPRLAPYFVGRETEVDGLAATLLSIDGSGAVLVQGGPGIGKTELTKAIARHSDVVARFGERRYFVRLETATTAEAMKDAVIRAVGCDPQYGFQAALASLRDRPSLLILDNLETPWEPLAERGFVHEALAEIAASPGLALLASIRGLEKVDGIRWSEERKLDALMPHHAKSLFTSIAGQLTRNDSHLNDFLVALGGIPLAIDLVARRAHGRATLAPLWEEWNRIGTELVRQPDSAAGRLTCLEQSIELSLRSPRMANKDHPAFRLLSFLGASPAGLTEDDASALLGADSFDAVEKLCHIGVAIERAERIDLLPPIREYARLRYKLDIQDTERWISHFLDKMLLVEQFSYNRGSLNLQYVTDSYFNFERVIISHIEFGFDIDNNRLHYFGSIIQMDSRSIDPLRKIAQHYSGLGESHREATCYRYLGAFLYDRSEYNEALRYYEHAMEQFNQYCDYMGQIDCLFGISEVREAQNNITSARLSAFCTISRSIMIGGKRGGADRMRGLALVAKYDGEFDFATHCFESAINLYDEINDLVAKAKIFLDLGDCILALGHRSRARVAYENAAALFRKMNIISGTARSLYKLGDISSCDRNIQEAEAEYGESYNLYKMIGNAAGMDFCAEKLRTLLAAD